jgi:hypothetical protein
MPFGVSARENAPAQDKPKTSDSTKSQGEAAAVAGKWTIYVNAPGLAGTAGSVLSLKVDEKDKSGKKLVGTIEARQLGELPITGEYSKDKLKFSLVIDTGAQPLVVDFEGKLRGDGMFAGTANVGMLGEVTWTAKRIDP